MASTPTKAAPAPSAATLTKDRYIHSFGYHLAKKLLGTDCIHDCVRQAYQSQEQDPVKNQLHCFRANWRSNVRFPWQLVSRSSTANKPPQALFVDITFDFLLFPTEVVDEGRTHSCHVLKKVDFWQNEIEKYMLGQEDFGVDEEDSIALSVGIRFGALVAMPNDSNSDNDNSNMETIEGEANIYEGDGYQYYYQRGDVGLTISDLDEYCRSIDIVLEDMDSVDVANILGDALVDDGYNAGVVAPISASSGSAKSDGEFPSSKSTQPSKHLNWRLSVHHKSLEANGILPLGSYTSGSGDAMGEPIHPNVLDMTLLQYNYDSRNDGSCFAVTKAESFKLWRKIDNAIVNAIEKPVKPSPKKMSPHKDVASAAAAAASATAAMQKKDEGDVKKEKRPVRRPPKPQEAALFARGKKTTLGGGRRKKPKFRLGPA